MAKQEKGKSRSKGEWDEGLSPLNRNAAGIDGGNAEHYVAVPMGRDPEPVQTIRKFHGGLWCKREGRSSIMDRCHD